MPPCPWRREALLIRSTVVLQSVKSRPRPHDQGSVWGRQKDSAESALSLDVAMKRF